MPELDRETPEPPEPLATVRVLAPFVADAGRIACEGEIVSIAGPTARNLIAQGRAVAVTAPAGD